MAAFLTRTLGHLTKRTMHTAGRALSSGGGSAAPSDHQPADFTFSSGDWETHPSVMAAHEESAAANQANVARKLELARRLMANHKRGTGGHALGVAASALGHLGYGDGQDALERLSQQHDFEHLASSSHGADIDELQRRETEEHNNAVDADYPSVGGQALRSLPLGLRQTWHRGAARVLGIGTGDHD